MSSVGWSIFTIVNSINFALLSEYLDIKGINFDLNQIFYGWDKKHIIGGDSKIDEFKPKLYVAKGSEDGLDPKQPIDEAKAVNRGYTESVDQGKSETNPLDKGKGIDRRVHPLPPPAVHSTEPMNKGKGHLAFLDNEKYLDKQDSEGSGEPARKKLKLDTPSPISSAKSEVSFEPYYPAEWDIAGNKSKSSSQYPAPPKPPRPPASAPTTSFESRLPAGAISNVDYD